MNAKMVRPDKPAPAVTPQDNRGRQGWIAVRRRLLGVALIVLVIAFLSGTIAAYQKMFTAEVPVTLHAGRAGNQMQAESDVKVNGLVVGRVDSVSADGSGAKLNLALKPDKVGLIPENTTARLLPKTLFGERYVSLVPPPRPSEAHLASGAVISQDRSKTSVELERVLSDLMPTLQTLRPEELSGTLNAMTRALDGRGEQIGNTAVQLNDYLNKINPALPDLRENLRQLSDVSHHYADAAPDAVRALSNLSATSRTLTEQRGNLNTMFQGLTTTSNDVDGFMRANGDNLIRLADSAKPTLDVFAKYSPAYPCFLKQMKELKPRLDQVFGVGTNEPGLHVKLEVTPHRGKYEPNQDEPIYGDKRGPRCYDLHPRPEPFPQYPPDGPVNDGSKPPPPAKTAEGGVNPPAMGEDFLPGGSGGGTTPQAAGSGGGDGLGVPNSPAERKFVASLVAPSVGMSPQQYPEWGSVLVGPLLRGAEVSYR